MSRLPEYRPAGVRVLNVLSVLNEETFLVPAAEAPKKISPISTDSTVSTQIPAEQAEPIQTIEDILAIPLRTCTACKQLQWQVREYEGDNGHVRQYRIHVCLHYPTLGTKPEPQRACRCVHFQSKW